MNQLPELRKHNPKKKKEKKTHNPSMQDTPYNLPHHLPAVTSPPTEGPSILRLVRTMFLFLFTVLPPTHL